MAHYHQYYWDDKTTMDDAIDALAQAGFSTENIDSGNFTSGGKKYWWIDITGLGEEASMLQVEPTGIVNVYSPYTAQHAFSFENYYY